MSTQPIEHKVYSYMQKRPRRPQEDVDFSLAPEQSKKHHENSGDSRGAGRDRIQTILSEIPKQNGNTLSFQDIVNYRDSLETEWHQAVTSDLKSLGVDMSLKFRLVHNTSTGEILASSDHPDKIQIDAYFASNPDRADEFRKIIKLGKLVDVAENKLSPQDMNQSLQTEAMAWWYYSNMDTASLFNGGGVVFGAGSSAYKGVDILV